MNTELKNTLILAVSFLGLFAVAEIIYRNFKIRAEITRKMVHVLSGLLTLLFPVALDNVWLVLLLCAVFALILTASLRFNFLPSVNSIDRKSYGSISYPLAVFICYCFYDWYKTPGDNHKTYLAFYLPVLTLAICDPLAALFGRRWPLGKYMVGNESKSLLGSAVFFMSAFGLSFLLLQNFQHGKYDLPGLVLTSAVIAFVGSVTEGLSPKGLDNLSIPLVTISCFYILSAIFFSPG